MNTRQIEYFLAVADELNFTRAAEKLFVSQTAVTQQIKALEAQLGVQLFERTKKKVVLTPAGVAFRGEGKELLLHLDAVTEKVRMISSGFVGALSIGFTIGMGNTDIADKIHEFHEQFPNINLTFRGGTPSDLLKALKNGELDLIFSPIFEKNAYEGTCNQIISAYPMIVVLPYKHTLASHEKISRQDLREENVILACSEKSEMGEDRVIEDSFRKQGISPKIILKTEDIETIFFMLSVNMGVTILPGYLYSSILSQGKLVSRPLIPENERVNIVAAWTKENKNPSLQKLLPFL